MSSRLNADDLAVLVWCGGDLRLFVPTVSSVRAAHPDVPVYIGGPVAGFGLSAAPMLSFLTPGEFSAAVWEASRDAERHVVVITAPVVLPPAAFDRAFEVLEDDLRIATLSFLSNAAGHLSVPYRNTPVSHQVGPHDEVSITRALREQVPAPGMVPISAPAGDVVIVSRFALGASGVPFDIGGDARFLLADFALNMANRGFLSVVDAGTYITRALDVAQYVPGPLEDGSPSLAHLVFRHDVPLARHDEDRTSDSCPLALAINTASAKIRGLRIIIDGSDLGPKEMGTQVQILSLVRELARRDDVSSIQLGVPGGIPAYARPFIDSEKITVFHNPDLTCAAAEPADILHRPSQPSSSLPFEAWRHRAQRVVVTLQDIIAYQVGAYFESRGSWMAYRSSLAQGAASADAVIAISNETVRHMTAECLPVARERVFVVPNGTDHMTGNEPDVLPLELAARGFSDQEFLLVLGTNYGHKNRDIAIRAWRLLRHTYPDLALVMAGAYVPAGSSRVLEAIAREALGDDGLFVLPDVTSLERNWLMRHARAALYPTSAEGFGLVPFESARFGTPSIGVRFAPLDEFNGEAPVWAVSWRPEDIASAVGAILEEPALAHAHVRATLDSGRLLSWTHTAAGLVDAYRTSLSLPARLTTR